MGISDHRTCLLRNLYAGHEATVREKKKKLQLELDMEQRTGSTLGSKITLFSWALYFPYALHKTKITADGDCSHGI